MNQEQTQNNPLDLLSIKLYTLTEVEQILGVSHRTLLRWVTDNKIEAIKVGGRWKVSEDTLKQILGGKQ